MNKITSKLLSFILSLCLITAMLPGIPALAATGDYEMFKEALDISKTTYADVSDIDPSFEGLVYTYNRTDNQVTIDVGLYNVKSMAAADIYFKYDPSDVTWMKTNASGIRTTNPVAVVSGEYTVDNENRLLGAAYMDRSLYTTTALDEINVDIGEDAQIRAVDDSSGYGPFTKSSFTAEIKDNALVGNILISLKATSYVTASNFTNVTTSGNFNSPENSVMPLYSLYFDVNDEATVDSNTFSTFVANTGIAGVEILDSTTTIETTGVAFVGFPYDVTFNVNDGSTAVSGATVTVYENGTSTVAGTGTTDSSGKAKISLVPGEYDYKVTATGLNDGSGTFTASQVGSTNTVTGTGVTVALTEQTEEETTYQVTWKFTDGTNPLEGVNIKIEDSTITTTEDGTISKEFAAGTYSYTATLDTYDTISDSFTVADKGLSINKVMTKSTIPKYNYDIKVTDTNNTALEGATVTIYDKDGKTKITDAKTNDQGIASFSLEAGEYLYAVTNGIWYVSAPKTTFTVSTNEAENTSAPVKLEPVSGSADPKYVVTGSYDKTAQKYKVVVTLENIKAVGASFGLKYDNTIFKLSGDPVYNEEDADGDQLKDIEITQPADENPSAGFAPQQNEDGYLTFGWYANNTAHVIDGDADEKPVIVTYYFDTIGSDWADWVDNQTFLVMPWTDTAQGVNDASAAQSDPAAAEILEAIWNAEEGKYMGLAAIADSEDGYADDGVPTPIGMEFKYDNQERHRLIFTVTEEGSAPVVNIENATIEIYESDNTDGEPLKTITTDTEGVAETVVANGSYVYVVKATDYWSNPKSENPADCAPIELTDENTEDIPVPVALAKKQYHDVTANVTNGTIVSEGKNGSQDVTDADPVDGAATETWTDHATAGVDLYFVTSPAAGFEMDGNPQYIIGDTTTGTPVDASFDNKTNQWYVPGVQITGAVTITVDYVAGTFKVTANLNAGGTLTWDTDNNGTADSFTSVTSPAEKTGIAMGGDSGELTFSAEAGYDIYQVVINGSDYPFDNPDIFEHTFEDITDNHIISVIFMQEGAEHPEEYVVSVLAGEYGSVSVFYGDVSGEILDGEASKDYIVTWGTDFMAVATPDSDPIAYEIDNVLVNDVAETIGDRTQHSITLSSSAEPQSIVATFRVKDTEERLQYLIKTEIVEGKGKVEPLGSRLYYAYEKPTFKFEPDTLWKTEYIEFNPGTKYEGSDVFTEYTFVDGVTEDVVISVKFSEIIKPFAGSVRYARRTIEEPENLAEQTLPEIVFVRAEDGKEIKASVAEPATTLAAFLPGDTTSAFTVDLPKGTYTIKATKGGHLDYVITAFTVDIDEAATEDITVTGEVEGLIDLTPGNTDSSAYITFMDILRVVNGMARYGTGAADIDETGTIGTYDIHYAKANYAVGAVNVDYTTHQSSASTIGS